MCTLIRLWKFYNIWKKCKHLYVIRSTLSKSYKILPKVLQIYWDLFLNIDKWSNESKNAAENSFTP